MKYLLFSSALFLLGCSEIFKSKTELLCEEEWVLYLSNEAEISDDGTTMKFTYHKKGDEEKYISFDEDGTGAIGEYRQPIRWKWIDEDDGKLRLEWGRRYGEYQISNLSSQELSWIVDASYPIFKSETYRHVGDPDWTDKSIDQLNEISSRR